MSSMASQTMQITSKSAESAIGTVEHAIARHIVSTEFASLPAAAIAATKEHILHTVATVLAGSSAPGVAELIEVLRDFGGRPASTIVGWDVRVPPAYAAMANSLMGHAQDFDNNDDRIAYTLAGAATIATFAVTIVMGQEYLPGRLGVAAGVTIGLSIGLGGVGAPLLGLLADAHGLTPCSRRSRCCRCWRWGWRCCPARPARGNGFSRAGAPAGGAREPRPRARHERTLGPTRYPWRAEPAPSRGPATCVFARFARGHVGPCVGRVHPPA